LISGPKQSGNYRDVYLQSLLEDLGKLWKDGLKVFDAYLQEYFILCAIIFCTINDYFALGNLLGSKIKGAKACPICAENTCFLRLSNCKKHIYMGHRRFLDLFHPYQRKKQAFDGKMESRRDPIPLSGKEVCNIMKDINIQFDKRVKPIKSDNIWKNRSILQNLPYWKHLEIRHCLDGMHIIKNIYKSLVGLLLNI
jgi:Transposase family tnp2